MRLGKRESLWLIPRPPNLLDIQTSGILRALATSTDPVTREIFPANSPYNQPQIIRALSFVINQPEAIAEKGNQGLPWGEEEDELLVERFNEGIKITQLAKLHSRTYGAIKARLPRLQLLQK